MQVSRNHAERTAWEWYIDTAVFWDGFALLAGWEIPPFGLYMVYM